MNDTNTHTTSIIDSADDKYHVWSCDCGKRGKWTNSYGNAIKDSVEHKQGERS